MPCPNTEKKQKNDRMDNLKRILNNLLKKLHTIEDAALVSALAILILISFSQIVMRNLFSSGFLWGDAASRYLVLWVGLLGAMAATRDDNHITIDIISRFATTRLKSVFRVITDLATAFITGILTYASFVFIKDELSSGMMAFGFVPTWIAEIIFPVAFGVISLRYSIYMLIHLNEAITGRIHANNSGAEENLS